MEKEILTLEDQDDFFPKGIYMPLPLKLEILKEAGKRQADGELGRNLGPFSLSEYIYEAIAEDFDFEIEKAPQLKETDKVFKKNAKVLLNRLPVKLRDAVEAEKERTGKPENQIIVDAIEKKIRGA